MVERGFYPQIIADTDDWPAQQLGRCVGYYISAMTVLPRWSHTLLSRRDVLDQLDQALDEALLHQ